MPEEDVASNGDENQLEITKENSEEDEKDDFEVEVEDKVIDLLPASTEITPHDSVS